MHKKVSTFCTEGHEALRLCSDKECKEPSPICGNERCNSFRVHKQCSSILKTNDIMKKLIKKQEGFSRVQDPILQFYRNVIDSMTRDMIDYENTLSTNRFDLNFEQEKLFKLLKEGPVSQITPQLVFKVSKSLRKDQILNFSEINLQLKKEVQLLTSRISKILIEIRVIWDWSQKIRSQATIQCLTSPRKYKKKLIEQCFSPHKKSVPTILYENVGQTGKRSSDQNKNNLNR